MHIRLKVFRASDGVGELDLDAVDAHAAQRDAERQGYTVLSIQKGKRRRRGVFSVGAFSASLFCQELLALLEAGLGLVESLAILEKKAKQPEVQQTLNRLHRSVADGHPFSRALEHSADVFPPLVIATVRASERTGDLVEALHRYLDYQRKLNAVRDKIVAASVYPVLLVLVGILVVGFLLAYVVPRFSQVYEDVGEAHLPLLSRWLMYWGQMLAAHAGLVGLLALGIVATLGYVLMRPGTRAAIERRLWRLPHVGEHLKLYQLARFTRTVAMLLKGGTTLVAALDMTGGLLRLPALQSALSEARREIREGKSISDTFGTLGLATEVGTRLLVVGERSGELGDVMERIAAFYDEEIARAVDWFSRLFEPVLMIAIGGLIGGIVILMYLPIFELASSIQ